jgi:hypothetical protein
MTKSPLIWFQYLCWCIQNWMSKHIPYYPVWLRKWLFKVTPDAHERWHLSQRVVAFWQKNNPGYIHPVKPLPWYIGEAGLGPLIIPWKRVQRFFRGFTGGRSHRCEFTDPYRGALYGHNEGAFMDKLFEQFIKNIEG